MNTVRRLLYRQIGTSVLFVTLAFMALFLFFDLVEELQQVGRNGYALHDALLACAFTMPGHLYDVFPITLLIGSIIALSRLAQSSEFTILRTAGLGPGRALALLGALGLAAAALTFALGEWAGPWGEQQLSRHKAQFENRAGVTLGRGGAWLRDTSAQASTGHLTTVNVGSASSATQFQSVRMFEFNAQGHLVRRLTAEQADVTPEADTTSRWTLRRVKETVWQRAPSTANTPSQAGQVLAQERTHDQLVWRSQLSSEVIAASVLPIDTMSTAALWQYTAHLARSAQAAQRYELQFWKKAFAPLACLVMMSLALPFAYLHTRSGGVAGYVFIGVMIGISFFLLNNMFGFIGNLRQWTPWFAAGLPSMIYSLLSLSAFGWLVLRR